MSNTKISQLTEFTGDTTGTYLIINNSGETTTYKVKKETLIGETGTSGTSGTSGISPNISQFATTGSNNFNGNQFITGSIIPSEDNTYNLGSITNQWKDLYISTGSVYLGGIKAVSINTDGQIQIGNQTFNTILTSGLTQTTISDIFQSPLKRKFTNSNGDIGEIAWDENYLYVCTDTNYWKNIPLSEYDDIVSNILTGSCLGKPYNLITSDYNSYVNSEDLPNGYVSFSDYNSNNYNPKFYSMTNVENKQISFSIIDSDGTNNDSFFNALRTSNSQIYLIICQDSYYTKYLLDSGSSKFIKYNNTLLNNLGYTISEYSPNLNFDSSRPIYINFEYITPTPTPIPAPTPIPSILDSTTTNIIFSVSINPGNGNIFSSNNSVQGFELRFTNDKRPISGITVNVVTRQDSNNSIISQSTLQTEATLGYGGYYYHVGIPVAYITNLQSGILCTTTVTATSNIDNTNTSSISFKIKRK